MPATPAGPQAQAPAQAQQQQQQARDVTRFACPTDLIDDPFTDTDGNVHETAIACLSTYGITQGTSATRYSPSQFVRRGQMASFLFRLLERHAVAMDAGDQGFADVAGHPHEASINAVASVGVARGRSAGRFAPQDLVTRGEMATFLARVAARFGPALPAGADAFDDDDGSGHEAAIDAVAAAGIAQGTGSRRFEPGGAVTRAAMAAFLTRLLDWGIERNAMTSFASDVVAAAALVAGEVTGGAGAADVTGTITLSAIGVDDVLCYELLLDHAGRTLTSVRVRSQDGTDVLTVAGPFPPHPTTAVSDGFAARCVELTPGVADAIAANPGGHRAEVLADGFPDGAAAGRLGRLDRLLVADLDGSQVVPASGDPDGYGVATVATTTEPDDLCYALATVGVPAPTAAALVRGEQVALVLDAPVFSGGAAGTSAVAAACAGDLDPALVAAVAASPQDFSVRIATADRPGGALQGPLAAAVR